MTTYWYWQAWHTGKTITIDETPDAFDALDVDFDSGVRVDRRIPSITLVCGKGAQGTLPDNLEIPGAMGLALSPRLRGILADAGVDNIDYYKCRITNPRQKTTTDDYMLGNVIGAVACVDRARSQLVMHPRFADHIQFIEKLVLDEAAVGERAMFRLAEFLPLIFVHTRVKDACEAADVTGVKFLAPDEINL